MQLKNMDKTMEKRIALILLLMISTFVSAKNDWKGKVVDEKGEPVAYANVAVLSPVIPAWFVALSRKRTVASTS